MATTDKVNCGDFNRTMDMNRKPTGNLGQDVQNAYNRGSYIGSTFTEGTENRLLIVGEFNNKCFEGELAFQMQKLLNEIIISGVCYCVWEVCYYVLYSSIILFVYIRLLTDEDEDVELVVSQS